MRNEVMVVIALLLTACTADSQRPNAGRQTASDAQQPSVPRGPGVILPDGFPVHVEVAADQETRRQGLMFRESLAIGQGMIFLFPRDSEYSFWMKDTLIPLDMIWIDQSGKIVAVRSDVPPCEADPCPSYSPGVEARGVLELAGGEAARHRLAAGQKLQLVGIDWSRARADE